MKGLTGILIYLWPLTLLAEDSVGNIRSALEAGFDQNQRPSSSAAPTPVPVATAQANNPAPAASSKRNSNGKLKIKTTLQDYRIEGSAIFSVTPWLSLGARGGLVNSCSLFGGPCLPFGTLTTSPYGVANATFKYQGTGIDALAVLSGGNIFLNSKFGLDAQRNATELPQTFSLSFALRARGWGEGSQGPSRFAFYQTSFSGGDKVSSNPDSYIGPLIGPGAEHLLAGSLYYDVISPWRLGRRVALAPFVGGGIFMMGLSDAQSTQALADVNAGVALAIKIADSDMVRMWGLAEGAAGPDNSYGNITPEGMSAWSLYYDGIMAGADYSWYLGPNEHVRGWVEMAARPNADSLIIGAEYAKNLIQLSPAFMVQQSRSPWFANEKGGALKVGVGPLADEWTLSALGSYSARSDISGQPLPDGYALMTGVTWTPGASQTIAENKRYIARQIHDTPDPNRLEYLKEDYSTISGRMAESFNNAVEDSSNFASFEKNIQAHTFRDILEAAALISVSQSALAYNYDDWREAYLEDQNNSKIAGTDSLSGWGASALRASELAIALGRRLGIELEAAPVTITRLGRDKEFKNYAAAVIRSPEYGFFFIDQGDITPTGTLDPDAALAVYQAQKGAITIAHYFGQAQGGGPRAARKITEQGKILLDALSFYGDPQLPRPPEREFFNREPRASGITKMRALDALRRTLMP